MRNSPFEIVCPRFDHRSYPPQPNLNLRPVPVGYAIGIALLKGQYTEIAEEKPLTGLKWLSEYPNV